MKATDIVKYIYFKKYKIKSLQDIINILYHAQMISLYVFDEPLFEDKIYLYSFGYKIEEVSSQFLKEFPLFDEKRVPDLDIKSKLIIDYALAHFKDFCYEIIFLEDRIKFHYKTFIPNNIIKDKMLLPNYSYVKENLDKKAKVNNKNVINGLESIIADIKDNLNV